VSTRPRPRWLVLWLWLAVPIFLVAAAVIALPMAFEETPADRADAVASLWPPVGALLALAALAAAAGWRISRRSGAETAGPPPS
jgi:bacteriorhodopsin